MDEQGFEDGGTAASAILSRTARMVRQIHPQIQRESQKQTERSESYEICVHGQKGDPAQLHPQVRGEKGGKAAPFFYEIPYREMTGCLLTVHDPVQ